MNNYQSNAAMRNQQNLKKWQTDPYSTPARRRRLIADITKRNLRNYYLQACHNIVVYRKKYHAAIIIQCSYRKYHAIKELLRLRYLQQYRCAIQIQCQWRQFLAKKKRRKLIEINHHNISIVVAKNTQRLWRGYKGRTTFQAMKRLLEQSLLEKRHIMALRIQRSYKAWIFRSKFHKNWRKYIKYKTIRRIAAIKIQCIIRLFLAKKLFTELRRRKYASVVISRFMRYSHLARKRKLFQSSCIINRSMKCFIARNMLLKLKQAKQARINKLKEEEQMRVEQEKLEQKRINEEKLMDLNNRQIEIEKKYSDLIHQSHSNNLSDAKFSLNEYNFCVHDQDFSLLDESDDETSNSNRLEDDKRFEKPHHVDFDEYARKIQRVFKRYQLHRVVYVKRIQTYYHRFKRLFLWKNLVYRTLEIMRASVLVIQSTCRRFLALRQMLNLSRRTHREKLLQAYHDTMKSNHWLLIGCQPPQREIESHHSITISSHQDYDTSLMNEVKFKGPPPNCLNPITRTKADNGSAIEECETLEFSWTDKLLLAIHNLDPSHDSLPQLRVNSSDIVVNSSLFHMLHPQLVPDTLSTTDQNYPDFQFFEFSNNK